MVFATKKLFKLLITYILHEPQAKWQEQVEEEEAEQEEGEEEE